MNEFLVFVENCLIANFDDVVKSRKLAGKNNDVNICVVSIPLWSRTCLFFH
jgi:hypothetical protein